MTRLYLKDPAASRFVGRGHRRGRVPPRLAAAPAASRRGRDGGREVFYVVRFHPRLRAVLQRFLQGLLTQIGAAPPAARAPGRSPREKVQAEYEAVARPPAARRCAPATAAWAC